MIFFKLIWTQLKRNIKFEMVIPIFNELIGYSIIYLTGLACVALSAEQKKSFLEWKKIEGHLPRSSFKGQTVPVRRERERERERESGTSTALGSSQLSLSSLEGRLVGRRKERWRREQWREKRERERSFSLWKKVKKREREREREELKRVRNL